MSKPIPGSFYTVVKGDTLWRISFLAYGTPYKWKIIYNANIDHIKPNPADPGHWIYPNRKFWIPGIPEVDKPIIPVVSPPPNPQALRITIGGQECPVTHARVMRALDTGADGWTASLPWTPGDNPKLDAALAPQSFSDVSINIGDTLILTGRLYNSQSELSDQGRVVNIAGWSKTADILDSTVNPPYTVGVTGEDGKASGMMSLKERAAQQLSILGLTYSVDKDSSGKEIDTGGKFDKITCTSERQKLFSHLLDLASQRGLLITNDVYGNLMFTRGIQPGGKVAPVAVFEEGVTDGVVKWWCQHEGRDRYWKYTATARTPGDTDSDLTYTVFDDLIPHSRQLKFKAHEVTNGSVAPSTIWRRNSQVAKSSNMILIVTGWLNPQGKIWDINTLVKVTSPTLWTKKSEDIFLIKQVEFNYGPGGRTTDLTLVPPFVYSMESIKNSWGGED